MALSACVTSKTSVLQASCGDGARLAVAALKEGLELIGDGLGLCDRPFHGCVLLDQRVLVDHPARLEGGDLVGGIEVLGRKPIAFLGVETVASVAEIGRAWCRERVWESGQL